MIEAKFKYHDFNQKLSYSRGACELNDMQLLKRVIAGCVEVVKTDTETDRNGIDYFAVLRGGAKIAIDAKTREKNASRYWRHGEAELALEIWSVMPCNRVRDGAIGWTLNERKEVDYILYTFDKSDSDKFFLLPFQLLRGAFRRNYADWKNKYPIKQQPNHDYYSEAMFVPASVVCSAVVREMTHTVQ